MVSATPIVERAAARAAARRTDPTSSLGWTDEAVDLVAVGADSWPDRIAIADRWRRLTYRELDQAVDVAALNLSAVGGRHGEPALLVARNDVASVIAIHAALRLGTVSLIAPSSAGRAQLGDIIDQARPTVMLAPEQMGADVLPDAGPGWRELESLERKPDAPGVGRGEPRPADEPSIVMYTSGTTSRPKGVIHSLSTLMAASRNFIDCAALHMDDRIFVVSPLASITGILQCITVPPMLGAQAVLETTWEPAATCDLLLERGGTFFGGPDLLLDRLLDEVEARGGNETTLEAVYLGGTMLDPRVLRRVEEQFGIVVMRAYGSSEAPISTAAARSEPPGVRLADDGAPLGGVEVRRGSPNAPDECCVTGPHLFLGYVDEEDDAHAFEVDDDGRDWFCTGDVAELDGGRIKIVGRIRDIAIRNGLNVPISEVEGYLNEVPGIARSAGYAVADPSTGERLAMAVLPAEGSAIEFDEVIGALRAAGLATWKLPEELVIWDEPFPENATGKVLRNRLEAGAPGRVRLCAPRLQDGGP